MLQLYVFDGRVVTLMHMGGIRFVPSLCANVSAVFVWT